MKDTQTPVTGNTPQPTITPEVGKTPHTLIQSYVLGYFFVSTIYRQSSAQVEDLWYYETCVFEWDSVTKKTGSMLDIVDSGPFPDTAIDSHSSICKTYLRRNKP